MPKVGKKKKSHTTNLGGWSQKKNAETKVSLKGYLVQIAAELVNVNQVATPLAEPMTFEETTALGNNIDGEAGPSNIVSNVKILSCTD